MEVPSGFTSAITNGRVCKLKKALYGLKQSSRAWFHCHDKLWIKQRNGDPTLFIKHQGKKFTFLIVYVEETSELRIRLSKDFEIKELGPLRYFLGSEVARLQKGIFNKVCFDLLTETGILGCKPATLLLK